MSSSSQDSYSVSFSSPPPPSDLGSYSRTMLQHTKTQMEAASRSSVRRTSSDQIDDQSTSPDLTNGVSSTSRNRNNPAYSPL